MHDLGHGRWKEACDKTVFKVGSLWLTPCSAAAHLQGHSSFVQIASYFHFSFFTTTRKQSHLLRQVKEELMTIYKILDQMTNSNIVSWCSSTASCFPSFSILPSHFPLLLGWPELPFWKVNGIHRSSDLISHWNTSRARRAKPQVPPGLSLSAPAGPAYPASHLSTWQAAVLSHCHEQLRDIQYVPFTDTLSSL